MSGDFRGPGLARRHVRRAAVVATGLVLVALPGGGRGAPGPAPAAEAPGETRDALETAAAQRAALRGLADPAARAHARSRAVSEYRRARLALAERPELAAEAAFRAGELSRAGGDAEGAAMEFAVAAELDRRGVFGFRATLELGHLARRAGDAEEALERYEQVLFESAEPRLRDQAAWWRARVLAHSGRTPQARGIWLRLAARAENPLLRVRAWERLVRERLAAGEPRDAAETYAKSLTDLTSILDEHSVLGERVRRAMQRVSEALESSRGPHPSVAGPEFFTDNPP